MKTVYDIYDIKNVYFYRKKSTKKLSNQFGYDSYGTWFGQMYL